MFTAHTVVVLFRKENLDPNDEQQAARVERRRTNVVDRVVDAFSQKGFSIDPDANSGVIIMRRTGEKVEIQTATKAYQVLKLFKNGGASPQNTVVIAGETYDDHRNISGLVTLLKKQGLLPKSLIYCSPRWIDAALPKECGVPVTPNLIDAVGWKVVHALDIKDRAVPVLRAASRANQL